MSLPPRKPLKPGTKIPAQKSIPTRTNPALRNETAAVASPAACAKCAAALDPGSAFCGECGTPVKKGAKRVRSREEVRRSLERGRNLRQVNEARKVLLWVGIANAVLGLLALMAVYAGMNQLSSIRDHGAAGADTQGMFMRLVLLVVVIGFELPAAIFFGLYVWAKTSPLPATIAGLVTYLSFMIAGIALNPESALSIIGWLIRIAIIGALAKGIQSASHEKKIREKERKRELARRAAEQAEAVDAESAEPAVE